MGAKGFVEGGIASIVAGCSTHPLDLIKVRMQLQGEAAPVGNPNLRPAFAYNGGGVTTVEMPHPAPVVRSGPVTVGVKIFQTEGVAALFSGISATVLRQTLYSTTRMGLYEIFREKWTDPNTGTFSLTRKITAGLLAGGIGAAVGNPADVAMVRMQADGRLPMAQRRLRLLPSSRLRPLPYSLFQLYLTSSLLRLAVDFSISPSLLTVSTRLLLLVDATFLASLSMTVDSSSQLSATRLVIPKAASQSQNPRKITPKEHTHKSSPEKEGNSQKNSRSRDERKYLDVDDRSGIKRTEQPQSTAFKSFGTQRKSAKGFMGNLTEQQLETAKIQDASFLNAVVKVYCTHTAPDYSLPWQKQRQFTSTGSAFMIGDGKLLKNAHCVEHNTQVKVKRRGDDTKYVAKVLAKGMECDIALLSVENEKVWKGAEPLQFGHLPRLQDSVTVVGYPLLLGIQIDAAINPGNSGGPTFNDQGECIGVAFQCPRQPGITECGYYVLKFMKEVIHGGVEVLKNNAIGCGKSSYTDADIDEVREDWASFVTIFVM